MHKKLFPLAAGLALLGLSPGVSAPAAETGGTPVLAPCTDLAQLPRARCGTIEVPLDRANPGLGTTKVAFALVARREASRPSMGTLVPNPGGPGAATIEGPGAYAELFAPLLDRRDLLLVDPRGTGRSGRLACPALAGIGVVFAAPEDQLARIGACGRELGPRVGAYGSAAVADDIEAVREVLGLERLDLWGDSYGTYLMPVYAARHPEHVRSIVLSGAYPIEFDPWGRDRLAAALRAIRLVCSRTRACDGQAVLRNLARLAARLRRDPVSFTVTAGAQRFPARLDEGALAALVYAGGNASYYGRLPAAVASALDGDLAPLRRLVESDLLGFAALLTEPAFSLAQNLATHCHDYPRVFSYGDSPAERLTAYQQALEALDPRVFRPFSPEGWLQAGFEAPAVCLEWPNDPTATSPLPPGTPLPDVPVLVLSGDLDANTPTLAGRQAAAQFPHATLVEIPNADHTPTSSPCAVALALRFINTLTANPRACARTGTPPPVAGPSPRRAAQLPLVPAKGGTRAQRRALGLIAATADDLDAQSATLQAWGSARGLRGGRYIAGPNNTIRLLAVRVVRDARLTGILKIGAHGNIEATLQLSGKGVADGRLQLRIAPNGRGRATGTLNNSPIDLTFRT